MSYSLNSLKGGYRGDSIWVSIIGVIKEDTRSVEYCPVGSYCGPTKEFVIGGIKQQLKRLSRHCSYK